MTLRSPFNGELWIVPPDCDAAFVEALVARGFTRVEPEEPRKKPPKEDRTHE